MEGNHNLDQDEDSKGIYANTHQATHGVTLGDLAAYVDDKRRHNGFEKEFEVSCSEDAPSLYVKHYYFHTMNFIHNINTIPNI